MTRGAGPPRRRSRRTHHLVPREPPLAAVAVVARGDAVEPLTEAARRALERGAKLTAAGADGWLVVLGDPLPWADGCTYVGRDGALLVPTTRAVEPSADLVAKALGGDALIIVLEDAVLRGPMPHGTVAL